MNEIIETYLTTSGISRPKAAKIREIACKVAVFYKSKDCENKPGMSTAQAKRAMLDLNLPDDIRGVLARRIDKYAAMVSGAKCDGSLMTEPVSRIDLSTPIKAVRF